MSVTVAFLYGFTEGAWHGKRFRKVLRRKGFKVIRDVHQADIVIAHSGGAFYVYSLRPEQQLVLFNPPYWPEKPVKTRAGNMVKHMVRSIRKGNAPFYQVHKTARNFVYLVRHARTNLDMLEQAYMFDLSKLITHTNTTLVHNTDDPWLTEDLDGLKKHNPHLSIIHKSGGHDDCWVRPERYIHLLQSNE